MPDTAAAADGKTVLVVGASRAIGLALAGELMQRGWDVVATVRGHQPEELAQLAKEAGRRLSVERLDLLFVNAGITDRSGRPRRPADRRGKRARRGRRPRTARGRRRPAVPRLPRPGGAVVIVQTLS